MLFRSPQNPKTPNEQMINHLNGRPNFSKILREWTKLLAARQRKANTASCANARSKNQHQITSYPIHQREHAKDRAINHMLQIFLQQIQI